ncbi:CARDB domain-containing protein [Methanobacterium sp.]|uniref:CARDB domain-containing protein n=1 Tax=Methanobacterium sp. TaxID=2164 RepID=UPI003C727E7D
MKKQLLILIIFFTFTLIICGTASASPDVVVTSISTATNVSPGSTITIKDTVNNTGTQNVSGIHVGYYIQNEYAVVKKPATQHNASIYEDTVVWSDYRYSRSEGDIYIKNVTTGIDKIIGNSTADEINPAVYGNVAVWQEDMGGYWNIIGYQIPNRESEIVVLSPYSNDQTNPSIYMDKIVWQQYDGTYWNIYLYDFPISGDAAMPSLKEATQITTGNINHINPYVNGNYIVWQQDDGTGNNWHIYAYDLSTGKISQVSAAAGNQTNPSIYGDNVVWQQDSGTGNNWDIYMCDISTKVPTQITNNAFNQTKPAIYGDKIVWQDKRNGNWDIYMYDLTLGIERQLTTNAGNQIDPAIYDNRVIWTDDRDDNEDIYITDKFTLVPEYTRYIPYIAAGKPNSGSTQITLPSDLKANVNYYIIAMVEETLTDIDGNTYDKILSTKMSSTPMIVPDVDITMPSISAPTKVQSGKPITVVYTVKNTGTKTSKPFYITFYLSKDSNITTSDKPIKTIFISGGLIGTSGPLYTTITIPSNISGTYYIGAIVDSQNNASETNKLNNVKASSSTITLSSPDLVAQSMSTLLSVYKKGSKITIKNTVKNQGNGAAKAFNVKFYLSKDKIITSSDTCLGQRSLTSLAAGGISAGSNSFTIPSTIKSGSYYLIMVIDPVNSIIESNKSNNVAYRTIYIY